ncbi:MAG: FAD-binding oxidoreductase [Deltaproteobacteria bacterium]|nr:FAD-binding oxidoreductase [Deltaproteobacteria bacterium]
MREVKIFPSETGVSAWLETSSFKNHQFNQPGEIESQYDFVVVGAGYGGFAAALRLAEINPGCSVAVFEAIRIGANDSGKNAGFLIDVPHAFGSGDFSHEEKVWGVRMYTAALDKMRKLIKDNDLKVDWDECGKYLASYKRSTFKHLDDDAKELDVMGIPYKFYEGEELRQKLGTAYYKKAIFNPGTVLVNPADVLRGLFTIMPKNVKVFEKTPVLKIEDGTEPTVILLNGRVIKCKAVIVTAGPFLQEFGLCKGNTFCPIISFGALTRKLNEEELEPFKDVVPWGITAGHTAGTTVRYTKDGRLFVRNGLKYGTFYSCSPERIRFSQRLLRKAFVNRFPAHKHVNFEYVYAGMIHLTMNSRSLFGRKQNVYYSGVGEGAGVCKSFTMGSFLAEWSNGIDSDILEFLKNDTKPSWMPPEPFTTVGAEIRLVYETLTAGGEI